MTSNPNLTTGTPSAAQKYSPQQRDKQELNQLMATLKNEERKRRLYVETALLIYYIPFLLTRQTELELQGNKGHCGECFGGKLNHWLGLDEPVAEKKERSRMFEGTSNKVSL